jgi:hypothetical protein
VELHDKRALDRAEIKLEFGGLLIHSHVDHFSHIYIDPPHQFILVGSALANEKQLDNRLPLQELQLAVIEEHFELEGDAGVKIDLVFMRCVTVSFDCAFGVDGSPFHEIGAWEFHGDVGLADEALESAEVD